MRMAVKVHELQSMNLEFDSAKAMRGFTYARKIRYPISQRLVLELQMRLPNLYANRVRKTVLGLILSGTTRA